jgi:hypothetical protein
MTSLFKDNGLGLRHKYVGLSYSAIATATNATNAVQMLTFDTSARLAFLFNSMDQDVSLYLVHPNQDSTDPTKRLLWMEFPKLYNLNYDLPINLSFDPGTKLYVSRASGAPAPTTGLLRVIYWG